MFVWSMKTTRPRLAFCGVLAATLLAVMLATGRGGTAAQTVGAGGDDAARVSYLREQGYEVQPQWLDVRELMVPDTDAVPAPYRGKRVKCFTYATTAGERVLLYEYEGKIVGVTPTTE